MYICEFGLRLFWLQVTDTLILIGHGLGRKNLLAQVTIEGEQVGASLRVTWIRDLNNFISVS